MSTGPGNKPGFFVLVRGWRDHPALQEPKPVPLSRAEAWAWLIEHAAYRDTRFNVHGKVVLLRRGQLCRPFRELAKDWGWSIGKVQDVVSLWVREGMLHTDGHTGKLILTICNYEQYQLGGADGHTQQHTPGIQEAYGKESQKEESKNQKRRGEGTDDAGKTGLYHGAAHEIVQAFDAARAAAYPDNPRLSPSSADYYTAQAWLKAGENVGFEPGAVVEMAGIAFRNAFAKAAKRGGRPIGSVSYLDESMLRDIAERAAGPRLVALNPQPPIPGTLRQGRGKQETAAEKLRAMCVGADD